MKVLIVGGGGREHVIAWKISQSPKVEKLYCTPDSAGITKVAECAGIGAMDSEELVVLTGKQAIDLVMAESDDSSAADAVDVLENAGIRVFGPGKDAAIPETSEALSRDLMKKYNIPSAVYGTFDSPEEALAHLEIAPMPIVLKADGLALEKGVLICNTREEAKGDIKTLMLDKQLGSAGDRIVVREFMMGWEVSVLSFVDGYTIKTMTSAQDHRRAKDGDQGLNTGGMGTFSPSPLYTDEVGALCGKYVYQSTVGAMRIEDGEFKGIILFGLMLTESGPKVLKYNARFGDPGTQVILPRMKNDIMDVFEACMDGTLDQIELEFEDSAAVCIVLASGEYPEHYEEGYKIDDLDWFDDQDGYYVLHAGSKLDKDGSIVTNGGGVLGVTVKGNILKRARENAYRAAE